MPRVAIATLGCKVNQYDSAALSEDMEGLGFQIVPFTAEADCYIINTCTVTDRTDYQSRQMIRRAIRRNPQALVVATGCYAQTHPEEIAGIAGVTVIAGNMEKGTIPRVVADLWTERRGDPPWPMVPHHHIGSIDRDKPFMIREVKGFPGHTRAWLKIQDGCNAFCSYCIVPFARGRSRSLHPEDVLRRIAHLADAGYREVVLTGIHLGCYGQDSDPPSSLVEILKQIEDRSMIQRLRLSSIEPREVTDDMLDLLRESTIICPHLHIPLQSGDDAILSAMNRNYDRAFFLSLVGKVLTARPDTAIGLDVMVGFPGEDEQAFDDTYHFIEEMPVAYLHVFPYSKRPGTPAADMKGQVSEIDKKRRAQRLRTLGREKRQAFMGGFTGKHLQVLLEDRVDKKTGQCQGFSQNYIPVTVVNGQPGRINTIVTVVVDKLGEEGLIGKIIDG
jgi:threonylcarbamoyladenosine tRNA methylthiotransferase MtaB